MVEDLEGLFRRELSIVPFSTIPFTMTDTNTIVASSTIAAPGEVELSEKKTIMLTVEGFRTCPMTLFDLRSFGAMAFNGTLTLSPWKCLIQRKARWTLFLGLFD